jgi:hypothetical protein
MRFHYVVLVAAVALLAGTNGVSAANSDQIAQVAPSDVEPNVVADQRLLKSLDTTVEDEDEWDTDEERAAFSGLKSIVWKLKMRSWYKAKLTPTQVNRQLIAKGGDVDWALATAYASYFRNLKYGPYAVEMIDEENDKNSS